MRTTHFSRSPKIAAFMKEYEFIREFGEGVDRMYRELEEGGWPKPIFKQDDFMLRASLSSRFAPITSPETSPETSQKTLQEALQKRDAEIVRMVKENPEVTTSQMSEGLGVSRQTIATRVKVL